MVSEYGDDGFDERVGHRHFKRPVAPLGYLERVRHEEEVILLVNLRPSTQTQDVPLTSRLFRV